MLRKPLAVELKVVFVPLPPEQRAAWVYAMRSILSGLMDKEMEAGFTDQSVTRGCRGQLTEKVNGTPLEGEKNGKDFGYGNAGAIAGRSAEGDSTILFRVPGGRQVSGHVGQHAPRKWNRRERKNLLDRGASRSAAVDRDAECDT